MDAPALTLREIARELNLPESTIRYYRDAFALYLPAVGMGRRRRYPADVLELFRVIAEGYSQNLNREDIEAKLQEIAPLPTPTPQPASDAAPHTALRVHSRTSLSGARNDELVATILDGERERREVMWQIAREIVRMGEALDRQQSLLSQIAQHLDLAPGRTLPPAPATSAPTAAGPGPEPATAAEAETSALAKELQALREELQKERELVERLRRSKLEIERRAAQAEAELIERRGG
ncbi:MAG: MerR family transcriptional regulator [Gemmatimonadetes bacterium]|nr:MerR family transcriptional regulator [Gemmatimonadota bacterium]